SQQRQNATAKRGFRVETLCQGAEADAALVEIEHDLDRFQHRAPEPVELPDHQNATRFQSGQRLIQTGPLEPCPGYPILENLDAPGRLQGVELILWVLFFPRHASIANHAGNYARTLLRDQAPFNSKA